MFQCCVVIICNANAISLKNCVHPNTCVDRNFQDQKQKRRRRRKKKQTKTVESKWKIIKISIISSNLGTSTIYIHICVYGI